MMVDLKDPKMLSINDRLVDMVSQCLDEGFRPEHIAMSTDIADDYMNWRHAYTIKYGEAPMLPWPPNHSTYKVGGVDADPRLPPNSIYLTRREW